MTKTIEEIESIVQDAVIAYNKAYEILKDMEDYLYQTDEGQMCVSQREKVNKLKKEMDDAEVELLHKKTV